MSSYNTRMWACIATTLFVFLGMQQPGLYLTSKGLFIVDCTSVSVRRPDFHHKGFCKASTSYYSNSIACFNIELLSCGDVASNPGPSETHSVSKSSTHVNHKAPEKIYYARHELYEIGNNIYNHRSFVVADVLDKRILELGISRKTRRGVRAGSRKQRKISVLCTPFRPVAPYRGRGICYDNLKLLPRRDESRLNFCSINTQSIRNKTIEFHEFVLQQNLDIVAISETWLRPDDNAIIAELTPVGFSFLHVPRQGKQGGGVGLLYRSDISICQKNDHVQYVTFESIHMEVTCNSKSVRLVNVYRSGRDNKGNSVAFGQFLNEFEDMIEDLLFNPSDIVICGDFNVHVDNSSDVNASKFISVLESHNLIQHVKEPTHTRGHCLDLVLTRTSSDVISEVWVHPGLSDHYGVMAQLNLTKKPLLSTTLTTRNLKQIDPNKFSSDVDTSFSNFNFENVTVESAVRYYESSLIDILNKHAPISTRSVRLRPSSPWFNEGIREARQSRRRLERKWHRTKSTTDRELYNQQKNVVCRLVNKAKTSHYSLKIEETKGDQKRLFNIVNGLLNNRSKPVLPSFSSETDEELAFRFSKYFSEKIANIRLMFRPSTQVGVRCGHELSPGASKNITCLNIFSPASVDEIKEFIMKSNNKSCELDPVPVSLIKACVNSVTPFITSVVNKSFSAGVFPDNLKVSHIRPLLKKTGLDKENLCNYRPISNLKFLSKILERVVCVRIQKHANENSLGDVFQSAYKPNHGVETALLCVHSDIMCALDNGEVCAVVLLDLSAAFDTVDHNVLLLRLENELGIHGKALNWFESYLSRRPQHVRIGTSNSKPFYQEYSVPQGSVLGPILFTVYTCPLRDVILKHNIQYHFYADDTQLYVRLKPSQSDVDAGIKNLEECLKSISQWMNDNFLKLNENKTEYMLVGSTKQLGKFCSEKITVGNSEVKCVHQARNLGVIFDSEMSMKPQISRVISTSSSHIHNIWKIRKYLTREATEQIVHSFVTCRLDMCNSLYIGLPKKQISRLQRVQNMAARLITRRKRSDSISQILTSLHWLPVSKRIIFKVLLITFKTLHYSSPRYLYQMLKFYNPVRNLRSMTQLQLSVPRTRTSWGDRAYTNIAPKMWNDIPLHIRQSPSVEVFKRKLKHYLFSL